MTEAKPNLVAAARLLSTMSEGDVYAAEPASVAVQVEDLDQLGALLIRVLDDVVVLEAEVERLRRELAMAGQAIDLVAHRGDPVAQRRVLQRAAAADVAVDKLRAFQRDCRDAGDAIEEGIDLVGLKAAVAAGANTFDAPGWVECSGCGAGGEPSLMVRGLCERCNAELDDYPLGGN